jgi:hypothetical protein
MCVCRAQWNAAYLLHHGYASGEGGPVAGGGAPAVAAASAPPAAAAAGGGSGAAVAASATAAAAAAVATSEGGGAGGDDAATRAEARAMRFLARSADAGNAAARLRLGATAAGAAGPRGVWRAHAHARTRTGAGDYHYYGRGGLAASAARAATQYRRAHCPRARGVPACACMRVCVFVSGFGGCARAWLARRMRSRCRRASDAKSAQAHFNLGIMCAPHARARTHAAVCAPVCMSGVAACVFLALLARSTLCPNWFPLV